MKKKYEKPEVEIIFIPIDLCKMVRPKERMTIIEECSAVELEPWGSNPTNPHQAFKELGEEGAS